MVKLPNLARIYPDQCGWMWACGGLRYSSRTESMAYELAGVQFDARCPDCGFGTIYDHTGGRAKMDALSGAAREIALDMLGNLDAPL